MIISIHIPKTAGTSLRLQLQRHFGERLLSDYEDWPEEDTPGARERNAMNRETVLGMVDTIRTNFDVIHGHFAASKYAGLFPEARLLTFVRDPYQHAISAYEHARRSVDSPHPGAAKIKDGRMSIVDFIQHYPNHQSLYLNGVELDGLAMIGVTERYDQSLTIFRYVFNIDLQASLRDNANPNKLAESYDVSDEVRAAVDTYRPEDVALYHRAQEYTSRMINRHNL
jgi:hypothetical protein